MRYLFLVFCSLSLIACGDGADNDAETVPDRSINLQNISSIEEYIETADVEAGREATRICQQCHTFNEGGINRVGPNLWGVYNSEIGRRDNGFLYSDAISSTMGVWSAENLNNFLYKPRNAITGTRMTYAGINDAQIRANVIAYLETLKTTQE